MIYFSLNLRFQGETKESSKEDWLGLGDEAVLMTSSENPAAKPDLKDTGKTNSKGITRQHSQDEWLGLGEEVFDSPKNIEATKTSTKNVDLEKQRGTEGKRRQKLPFEPEKSSHFQKLITSRIRDRSE